MKRILVLTVLASIIAASRASAADLPVRTGPAPAYYPIATVYDWGGGYIGINGGYAFGQSQWSDPFNPSSNNSTGNFNVNGGLVGATMGVSGQFGAWVLSVEGDFDWQGLRGSSSSAFCTSILTSSTANSTAAGWS
jgi:outer membrane immunogenic protein